MADILMVADQVDGELKKSTLNVIDFVRKLAAQAGGGFDIAVIGHNVGGVAAALTGYGAEKVYTIDAEDFAQPLAQPYANALSGLMEHAEASYLVASSSTTSKDVLPRVAAQFEAGMVAECTDIAGDGLYKRPMYAGNVLATVRVNTDATVITVRTAEFDAAEESGGASPIEAFEADPGEHGMRFVKFEGTASERPELTEADCVVAGGRGLKSGEKFYGNLEPLADLMGAAIGATRAAVDSWDEVPNDLQVGQTGKVVAPDLYFAVALSGAIQHVAGMKNAKTIVAINKDEEAPIFSISDYGLVADAFKAMPELVDKIKAVR